MWYRWLRLLVVICAVAASEPVTSLGMQSVKIAVDGSAVTEVNYRAGQNVTQLAEEIVEKLGLKEGYGCGEAACVVGVLSDHLASNEPRSLKHWLQNSGWNEGQIAMLNDVININFWHFAMLNDVDRNEKFDAAIRAAVARVRAASAAASADNPVCVLDLGSGSGLLAMMASRAGADVVHAIEQSDLLSEVGPSIVARNGFRVIGGAGNDNDVEEATAAAALGTGSGGLVRWHHKSSEAMTLEGDLGGRRCQVLVSETLGVSVLDEEGLKYMADLRDRLLLHRRIPPRI